MPSRCARPPRFVVVFVAVLAACGRADDEVARQPMIPLAELFRFGEQRPPTSRIVLGDPRDQPLLGSGWGAAETLADGSVVRRNAASTTRVSFDVGPDPGPLRLVLNARFEPPADGDPRRQREVESVRIRVNDAFVGAARISSDLQAHPVELRREHLRPGRNEVVLKHVGTIDRRGRRPRRGATYFYQSIAFEPLSTVSQGSRLAGDGSARLIVPPGSEASFFFRVPAGAELRLTVEPPAAAPTVGVTLEGDGLPARRLALRPDGEQRVPIELAEGTVARLAAHVPADGSEVTLIDPIVWGRPPATAPGSTAAPAAVAEGANLLLYVVDTLRADRLGCYGHAAPTSPAIDGLARDGILFEHVVAQSSWTRPATASILTGVHPGQHGAITLDNAIVPSVPTLAELLRAAGYRTGGFVTNVNVADQFGFGRGFEVYRHLREEPSRASLHVPASELHAEFLAWLDEHAGERVFAYLHATDPHGPYTPSADARRRLGPAADAEPASPRLRAGQVPDSGRRPSAEETDYLGRSYDAEIAGLDAAFGDLLGELARRGLLERTVIVVVADHGEEFAEHGGFGHGRTLYREQLHVPFIVRLPERAHAGTRVGRLARQVDVLPTMLALLAVPPPPTLAGVALLEPTGRPSAHGVDETHAETRLGGRGVAALVATDWKAIVRQTTDGVELYDLRRDPDERHDLAASRQVLVGYARQRLLELAAEATIEPAATVAPSLDAETVQRLEALGYLH